MPPKPKASKKIVTRSQTRQAQQASELDVVVVVIVVISEV